MSKYSRLGSNADRESSKLCTMPVNGMRPPLAAAGGAGGVQEDDYRLQAVIDGTIADAAATSAARKRREERLRRESLYSNPTAEFRNSPDAKLAEKILSQEQRQNIENGDPNVRNLVSPASATGKSTPPVINADNLSSGGAGNGCESGAGIGVGTGPGLLVNVERVQRGGGASSARWVLRNAEEGGNIVARSTRTGGGDSFRKMENRGSGFSACRGGSIGVGQNPPPSHHQHSPGVWEHRAGTHREAAALPHPQDACVHGSCGGRVQVGHKVVKPQQENRSCAMHACGEACQAHRSSSLTKNSTIRSAMGSEKPPLAVTPMQPHQVDVDGTHGSTDVQFYGKSGVTRSCSFRELKPSIEKWSNHTATRSLRGYNEKCNRVSFPGIDAHEVEREFQHPVQWKEPIPHTRKMLSKHVHPDLRYNYEQPGFVDRETEVSGKPYTIYGVRNVKESSRGFSHSRPQKFVRAFSVREHQSSNYTRISRAMSVNGSGRNVLPVDCVTCGQGVGVVFFGPSDESFCQSCRTSNTRGWNCPGDGDRSSTKKKKGILDYCRKLLKLPKKLT